MDPKRPSKLPTDSRFRGSEPSEIQRTTFEVISDFISRKGFAPSIAELAEMLGIGVPAAFQRVEYLVRKGFLKKEPGKSRSLTIARMPEPDLGRMIAVTIFGRVAAGTPLLSEENRAGEVLVDEVVASRGPLFALSVQGESMVGAGIKDGDIVIVRQQPVAERGDIVVALLRGEATVKRLSIEDELIELRPENPSMKPIRVGPDDDLRILGKVVAVRSVQRDQVVPTASSRRPAKKGGQAKAKSSR